VDPNPPEKAIKTLPDALMSDLRAPSDGSSDRRNLYATNGRKHDLCQSSSVSVGRSVSRATIWLGALAVHCVANDDVSGVRFTFDTVL